MSPVSPLLHVIRGREGDSVRLLIHDAVLHETLNTRVRRIFWFVMSNVTTLCWAHGCEQMHN